MARSYGFPMVHSFMNVRFEGLERITANPAYNGGFNKFIDQKLEYAAKHLVYFIQRAYREGVPPANHPVTDAVNSFYRGISAENDTPLHKTGGLANAVKYDKASSGKYDVFVDPFAYPEHGNSSYEHIASLMETGYVIPVTQKVKNFWMAMHQKDPQRISPVLNAPFLVVPSRPVWEPVSILFKHVYGEFLKKEIKELLTLTGTYQKMKLLPDKVFLTKKPVSMKYFKEKKVSKYTGASEARKRAIKEVKRVTRTDSAFFKQKLPEKTF